MIKNLMLILMSFSLMISTCYACGTAATNVRQVQQQDQNGQVPQNNPTFQDVIPEIPQPQTFSEILKDVAGDFSVPNRNNTQNDGAGGLENLPQEVAQLIDDLEASLNLPVFSGDTDDTRIARNDKQIEVALELLPKLQTELTTFLNDANKEINEFTSPANAATLAKAPDSVIQGFFDEVGNLHEEFFRDVVNAVRTELGNNLDDASFALNENNGQIETNLNEAQIGAGNANVPSAQEILKTLAFQTKDFLKDFEFAREATLEEINNKEAVSQQSSQINSTVDFDSALDSGFESPTRQKIGFNVLDSRLLLNGNANSGTFSLVRLLENLQDAFPGTALAKDLEFFLNIFPPATEQIVQDTLGTDAGSFINEGADLNTLTNTQFNQSGNIDNFDPNNPDNTFSTGEFVIGADGRLIGVQPGADSIIERSENITRVFHNVSDLTGGQPAPGRDGFNTRTFGGSPGDFPSVQITVGDQTYEVYDHVFTSPLVLDLDSDGKLEASGGVWLPHIYKNGSIVEFDINGDGFVDLTEWVGKNDGLLVQYNPNEPMSGAQLFGDADGFINGYEKLRTLDANEDNIISGEELNTLSVWQDKNSNAKVDSGEILSLEELKITELSVKHNAFVSEFVMDGKSTKMWDWYPSTFRVKKRK